MNRTEPTKCDPDEPATGPASASHDSRDDSRLWAAVQEYNAEVEAGRRPDRRAFLERHRDVAGELSVILQGLAFVNAAAAQMGSSAATTPAAPALTAPGPELTRPLGDFRLVQEIGRGGMGIVYEAVQLSLGRRVAVKVLPMAAALDPRQLQRFHNEAQAAAQLHHNNIVPVYAVGCDRSVHYYAMQLIEGQSLAEVIRDLRAAGGRSRATAAAALAARTTTHLEPTVRLPRSGDNSTTAPAVGNAPGFVPSGPPSALVHTGPAGGLSTLRAAKRTSYYQAVARLGAQAADALEYAHRVGIVHRDVKPANLMIDGSGTLWVTDFGLAQFYARDAGLTQAGDVFGTLRYMSPEQAYGRTPVLDQRTDVYSLGVTLYELLTLEPALPGQTREQLLREIDAVDPRPARSIDRAIPHELDTILAKAMAKDPAERYPTAATLADDLRRFLADQPILARPPSVFDQALKWGRRHRAITYSAVAMLLLALVALSISTVLIARERTNTEAAYVGERIRATEAQTQRARADRSFREAREVVDAVTSMAVDDLADKPQDAVFRKTLLDLSLRYYEGFLADREDDPTLAAELAGARANVGLVLEQLSKSDYLRRFRYVVRLLNEPSVRDELKLSPGQVAQVEPFVARFANGAPLGRRPEYRQLSTAQRVEAYEAVAAGARNTLAQILTPAQIERHKQIAHQLRGPLAFTEPEVAAALGLTDRQVEVVRAVSREYLATDEPHHGPPSAAPPQTDPAPFVARVLATLTPAQASLWKTMTGQPFTGHVSDAVRGPRHESPAPPATRTAAPQ